MADHEVFSTPLAESRATIGHAGAKAIGALAMLSQDPDRITKAMAQLDDLLETLGDASAAPRRQKPKQKPQAAEPAKPKPEEKPEPRRPSRRFLLNSEERSHAIEELEITPKALEILRGRGIETVGQFADVLDHVHKEFPGGPIQLPGFGATRVEKCEKALTDWLGAMREPEPDEDPEPEPDETPPEGGGPPADDEVPAKIILTRDIDGWQDDYHMGWEGVDFMVKEINEQGQVVIQSYHRDDPKTVALPDGAYFVKEWLPAG